jgi:hypothetical protein
MEAGFACVAGGARLGAQTTLTINGILDTALCPVCGSLRAAGNGRAARHPHAERHRCREGRDHRRALHVSALRRRIRASAFRTFVATDLDAAERRATLIPESRRGGMASGCSSSVRPLHVA